MTWHYWLPLLLALTANPQHGLAMAYNHCSDISSMKTGWYYGWSPIPKYCPADTWGQSSEPINMIWGRDEMYKPIGTKSRWLFGFNEPDLTSQSNITPTLAATMWRELESIHSTNLLVSPATLDLNWLREWRTIYYNQYNEYPRLTALALHVYENNLTSAKNRVLEAEALAYDWNLSSVLWVTEYAFLPCDFWWEGINHGVGNMTNAVNIGREFTQWLIARGHRYAWFSDRYYPAWGEACNTALIDAVGNPTPLGIMYQSVVQ